MAHFFYSRKKTELFIRLLKDELTKLLPGIESHLRLAPEFRKSDLLTGEQPLNATESSVLILLYPFKGRLKTVVILRNEYDGVHSGQISLPGGKTEISDTSFEYTALREAKEEIGINPSEIEIVGQLSRFYVKPSNYLVYPFIGYTSKKPDFHPDTTEVQRIIEIDIFKQINYDSIVSKTLTFKNNVQFEAPGFVVENEFMWGATAMIFSELIRVLSRVADRLD